LSQSVTFHGQQRQKPSLLSLDPARSKYPFLESLFGAPVCVFTSRVILMLQLLPRILFLFGVVFWLMRVVGFGWTWSDSIKVGSFGGGQVFFFSCLLLFFLFDLEVLVFATTLGWYWGIHLCKLPSGVLWKNWSRLEVDCEKKVFFFFFLGCLSVMKGLEGV